MAQIATDLSVLDYTMYSGGAGGADSVFETHSKQKKIFLPWDGFNGKCVDNKEYFIWQHAAKKIAEKFHPKWKNLEQSAIKFHTRNVHQILGENLNEPVDFVVCWTADGKASGGTGQAIRIANYYDIKVFNLYNTCDRDDLYKLINELEMFKYES